MPRSAITDTLASSGAVEQYDYLKLVTGEYARLCVVYDDVYWEWVHSMRAPVLDERELPIIVPKLNRKGDVTGTDYSMGFVGQRICMGDPAILEDKGLDPARCPACASSARGFKGMSPERRFALPVIRYKCTKRNSTDLPATPGGDIVVWKLSQRGYNELVGSNKKAIRDLLEIPAETDFHLFVADIVLYCADGNFQRNDFKPPLRPGYRDERWKEWIREVKNDADRWPTDAQLKAACVRDGDRDYMMLDVESLEDRWRKAEKIGKDGVPVSDDGPGPVSGGRPDPTLDQSMTDLLADHPGGLAEFAGGTTTAPVLDDPFGEQDTAVRATREPARPAAAPPATASALDDPFGEDAPAAAPPAPAAAPAEPARAAAPAPGRVQSFDDILGD